MPNFTQSDLDVAISRLSTCAFFPTLPTDRAAVSELLADLVPDREGLEWLTTKYRDDVGVWSGAASLQAMCHERYTSAKRDTWHTERPACPYCKDHRGYEITYSLRTQERRGSSLFTRFERITEQQYHELHRTQLPENQGVFSGAKPCRCGILARQDAA